MNICKSNFDGILPKKERIIVIGDLHADYNKTIQIFIKLKLIDNNNNWIAIPKNTIIVQLGDILDGGGRGHNEVYGELALIDFLENIHKKATKHNGGVYSLIGNHEIMNLIGDFSYSSKKDIIDNGGIVGRKKFFSPGGDFFNKISCTHNVIMKIGDFVFVHAGILPEHINDNNKDNFIKKINHLMKLFLQGKKTHHDSDIQNYFLSKHSMIWNRDYGAEKISCDKVKEVNNALNVGHMIVGHSIQDTINSKCNNSLWRVDIGLSNVFDNSNNNEKFEVLEILDNGEKTEKNNNNPFRIIKL